MVDLIIEFCSLFFLRNVWNIIHVEYVLKRSEGGLTFEASLVLLRDQNREFSLTIDVMLPVSLLVLVKNSDNVELGYGQKSFF